MDCLVIVIVHFPFAFLVLFVLNFVNAFIQVQFTYHKNHPHKVYSSVVLAYLQGYATITTI